jgi:hypothetical protein
LQDVVHHSKKLELISLFLSLFIGVIQTSYLLLFYLIALPLTFLCVTYLDQRNLKTLSLNIFRESISLQACALGDYGTRHS